MATSHWPGYGVWQSIRSVGKPLVGLLVEVCKSAIKWSLKVAILVVPFYWIGALIRNQGQVRDYTATVFSWLTDWGLLLLGLLALVMIGLYCLSYKSSQKTISQPD